MNAETSQLAGHLPTSAPGAPHHLADVERSLDSNDPAVRRVVYNLYRGLLGTYNDKANCMISALPPERVREDQGISRQLESMINQSSKLSGGHPLGVASEQRPSEHEADGSIPSSNMASSGGNGAPPLPPPLPASGLPSVRINSEIGPRPSMHHGNASAGAKHLPGGGSPFSYIPPSAIQNAMMTKDKKPFTYTPGGLDLSEIRSPRMVRRISKNAMDEGVASCPLPTSPPSTGGLSPLYLPPQAVAAMQPQLSVPVFPPTPPPPPPPPAPSTESINACYANFPPPPPPSFLSRSEQAEKTPEIVSFYPRTPSPPPPPVVSPVNGNAAAQLGSIYVPPVTPHSGPTSPPLSVPAQTQLNKTPMPWMNSHNRMPSLSPPQFAASPSMVKQGRTFSETEESPLATHPQVRIIPLHIEGRDPPPPVQQSNPHISLHSNTSMNMPAGTTRVVPIQLEADVTPKPVHYAPQAPTQQYSPPAAPTTSTSQFSPPTSVPVQPAYAQQAPWRTNSVNNNNNVDSANAAFQSLSLANLQPGSPIDCASPARNPIQSRSFRILQMMTDAEEMNSAQQTPCGGDAVDSGRLSRASVSSGSSGGTLGRSMPGGERRLELTQDDQQLMSLFKTQVSEDSYLHTEADPRYRGSHIPSRAFRCLQNFTDSSDINGASSTNSARVTHHAPVMAQTMRPAETVYRPSGPPSEQPGLEPRKYMGGNIPSRSFRILQAMTATEPTVQRDDGYVCQASEVNSPEIPTTPSHNPATLQLATPHVRHKDRPSSFLEELQQACQKQSLRQNDSSLASRFFPDLPIFSELTTSEEPLSKPDIIVQACDTVDATPKAELFYEKIENASATVSQETVAQQSNDIAQEDPNAAEVSSPSATQTDSEHSCLLSYFCSHPPSPISSPVRPFSPSLLFQEMVFPASEEGKTLRVRSKRSRDHIPSRIFKFLQAEYDQDPNTDLGSPVTPVTPPTSRLSLFLESFSAETYSSGASEIEGFMGSS